MANISMTEANQKKLQNDYGKPSFFLKTRFLAHILNISLLFLGLTMTMAAAEEAVNDENPLVLDESPILDPHHSVPLSTEPLSPEYETARRVYTQLAWATYLHTVRRLSDAKEMYLRVLERYEPSAFIHTKFAELNWEMQDIKSAERECRRAIELQPDNAAPHFLLGELLIRRIQQSRRSALRWDDVIAEFRKVIELQPDHIKAHQYLAGIANAIGNHELAIQSFKELTRIMPYHARSHMDLAKLYEGLDQSENAVAAYERAVKIDRDLAEGYEALVKLYIRHFDQMMARAEPTREELEGAKKSLENAIRSYEELRRLGNNSTVDYDAPIAQLRARLGSLYVELGDAEQAIEVLGQIHRDYPDNVDANYWLGVTHQQQGDFEKAFPYLKRAAALAPGRVMRRYFALGQYEEAIDILQDVLRDEPDNVEAIYWTGLAYESLGDFQKTERYLREAISRDPEYADALNALGYFFAENGTNLNEAVELIKKALKKSPQEAGYLDSLGWAYFKQGKLDKALRQLEMAIRLMPQSSEIQDHLGDAYMKKGLKGKAIAAWRRAIRLEPNNTAIQEKLKAEVND